MLSTIFRRVTQYIRTRLNTFDEKELELYSRTLSKFVESITRERQTTSTRDQLIKQLRKELIGSVKYPQYRPFMQLQQVTGLSLEPFGSSIMGTSLFNGDLDISLNGVYRYRKEAKTVPLNGVNREIQVMLLSDLMRFLKERRRVNFEGQAYVVRTAKVPILRYTDRKFGIQCDFSIGNLNGIYRSKVGQKIVQSDYRIKTLVILVKKWAKVHGLNDPSRGSFGSYALTVMILAFCVERGVLDPLYLPMTDPPEQMTGRLRNNESVLALMLSLFCSFAYFTTRESLFDGLSQQMMICCKDGGVVKTPKRLKTGKNVFFVQDPFAPDKNCAKPVTQIMLHEATRVLQKNLQVIANFLEADVEDRKVQWLMLFRSLFQTNVKFKGQSKASLQYHKTIPGDSELLQHYDTLIEDYLGIQQSKKFKLYSNAFENSFLLKFQKRYMESIDCTRDVNSTKLTGESVVL
eukprot:g3236.t1